MKLRSIVLSCTILVILLQGYPTLAQEIPTRTLIAMGSSYSGDLRGFWDLIQSKKGSKEIRILILPLAYSNNPRKITKVERNQYLRSADEHRTQIERDCQQYVSPASKCTVTLIPILVRSDTTNMDYIKALESHPTAILILGEEQTNAMQVIASTSVEVALSHAYQDGVIIGGAGAGAGIQSISMIAGYNPGYEAMKSLNFGSTIVWQNPLEHGLLFGLEDTIVEPHFYSQNRFGRLLNAINLPDTPHLGIGIDTSTGFQIVDEILLERVFGQNTVTILDAETYHSAEAVRYQTQEYLLSIRNVLVHMLSPGEFTYSLQERKHSLAPFQARIERSFDHISLPPGTGSIIISTGLSQNVTNDPLMIQFLNMSGGKKANLLVITVGYLDEQVAKETADGLIDSLDVRGQVFISNPVSSETLNLETPKIEPLKISQETTGIVVIGDNLIDVQLESISAIYDAWQSGTPLFIEGPVSAIVGKYFATHLNAPSWGDSRPARFYMGEVELSPGLSLLDLNIEPQVMEKNNWVYLFSLAYQHPEIITLGLTEGAAILFSPKGARAHGGNVIFTLDLSQATLDLGTNQGFVIANGLLDVFAPGDLIEAEIADMEMAPISISTPSLDHATIVAPMPTKTPIIIATPTPNPLPGLDQQSGSLKTMPSKTPQPDFVSAKIPPADPNMSRVIIGGGILIVLVVIFGVWVNRLRLR